jgi:hypothetical protein
MANVNSQFSSAVLTRGGSSQTLRGMRATWVVLALAAALGACGTSPPPSDPSPEAVATLLGPSPPFAAEVNCPGDRWPPYDMDGIPGITARSLDRATIQLANRTVQKWYYRIAGWQVLQLDTCRGLVEQEVERGPIAPGATIQTTLPAFAGRMDVPITIAFWDQPCGEACRRAPVAAMELVRSPEEPGTS